MRNASGSVALTFDAGWESYGTAEILHILRHAKLQVTMFLTGVYIRRHPDLVLRMVEEGHEIGNHTDSHPCLTSSPRGPTREGVTRTSLHQELCQAEAAFQKVAGRRMSPLWRAPYGHFNAELLGFALELGYRHVYWTLDTNDWVADRAAANYRTARQIRDHVLRNTLDGDIILMHLGTLRPVDRPLGALPGVIIGLRQKSFYLVTVSELFARQAQGLVTPPLWRWKARELRTLLRNKWGRLRCSLRLLGRGLR